MTAIDPTSTGAHGVGLATIAADGTVLDTWFPSPNSATHPPWARVACPPRRPVTWPR
ncbi:hypothetical protein [Nonomuraea recticatena]|uniref:hypothetical protein n=1 Tax=Nonomuraea recticatena TaxID=46178 RepID=UPI00361CBFBB